MATDFTAYPEGLDSFTNPTQFDNLDTTDVPHHEQESQQNDAIMALEEAVGITGSADTDSHEYKIAALIAGTLGGAIVGAYGTPEGSVTAPAGSTYWDTTSKSYWIKDTGSGNTGWYQLIG